MKKRVAVLSIIGLILMIAALVVSAMLGGWIGNVYEISNILANFMTFVAGVYQPLDFTSFIGAGVAGLLVILLIIQIILAAKKKHGAAAGLSVVIVLAAAISYLYLNLTLAPGQAEGVIGRQYGLIGYGIVAIQTQQWIGLLFFAPALVYLIAFILMLVAIFSDMKLLADLPNPKLDETAQDDVMVIHDEDREQESPAEEAQAALIRDGVTQAQVAPCAAPSPNPAGAVGGVQGPIIVQYINTYAPAGAAAEAPAGANKKNTVPVQEIQGAITGEKPLTAEDIRKIVKEEMGEKNDQPVIVNVPAAPKQEPVKGLTAEEVRAIFSEEIGRYLTEAAPEEEEEGFPEESEILVEEEPVPALTAEDVRSIIATELARAKAEEAPAAAPTAVEKPEEPIDVRAVIRDELEAHRRELDEEARKAREEEAARKAHEEEIARARAEAAEEARRQAEEEAAERPAPLTAEDIRAIIAAELAKKVPEEKPEPEPKPEMTLDLIREVIRSELRDVAPVKEQPVPPVTVVLKESDIVRPQPEPKPEEPKPEPPVVNIIVKQAEPAPEPEPAVEQEAAPAPVEEAPRVAVQAVEAPAEEEEGPAKEKIIRIPFPTRMNDAEEDLRKNYNELKAEIMSYGVKSRVSNSGDTFRLHKVTFVKITIAGKGLKLYFALNPADYANSTLPVQDAGHKGTYRDIPLVFKVKSELSVRRAKQLIADVMEKNGLEQGRIEPRDWAASLKDYKPAGADDDED